MELVQRRLESSIPELQEILRINLLSEFEVRQLVKRRQQYEAKLRRVNKSLENVVSYIDYEKNLLRFLRKRRERLLIDAKKAEIDVPIAKRISKLYKTATDRFPTEESLWIDWLGFCKELKWHDQLNVISLNMLKRNINSTKLYIVVAKYKMEDGRSPEDARKVFQMGVLHNPSNPEIWKEFFRMELMNIDKLIKRKEILQSNKMDISDDTEDAVLRGDLANIVFDQAVETIKEDVNFTLSFIDICLEFDFGNRHVSHIISFAQRHFPEAEETLDAVAKEPLLHIQAEILKGKETNIKKKTIVKSTNDKVYANYEDILLSKNTERMWTYYIDFVISLMNIANEKSKMKYQNRALDIMNRAASNDCLNEEYSLQLLDFLHGAGDIDRALDLSKSFSRKFQKVEFWYKCIDFHVSNMEEKDLSRDTVYSLLMEGLRSINPKTAEELCKFGVEWLSLCYSEKMGDFLESGVKMHSKIAGLLKKMRQEWLSCYADSKL